MPSVPVTRSLIALITKLPPSRWALAVLLVYVSSSLLPHPLPPVSKDHLLESTAEPLGPSNSSLQTRLHTVGLLAYAIGYVGRTRPGTTVNKQVNRATTVILAAKISLRERESRTFFIFIFIFI